MTETSQMAVLRKAIDVSGIVQGVGFRPFVYRLANAYGLTGYIANTPAGVSIEVEGPSDRIEEFLDRLPKEIPPLAKVTSLSHRDAEVLGSDAFRIVSSHLGEPPKTLISL